MHIVLSANNVNIEDSTRSMEGGAVYCDYIYSMVLKICRFCIAGTEVPGTILPLTSDCSTIDFFVRK